MPSASFSVNLATGESVKILGPANIKVQSLAAMKTGAAAAKTAPVTAATGSVIAKATATKAAAVKTSALAAGGTIWKGTGLSLGLGLGLGSAGPALILGAITFGAYKTFQYKSKHSKVTPTHIWPFSKL